MANCPSLPLTRACRMIWATMRLCGRPAPLNRGSFCPRTRAFRPSMAEMPVSMNSAGGSRLDGLIGSPFTSR